MENLLTSLHTAEDTMKYLKEQVDNREIEVKRIQKDLESVSKEESYLWINLDSHASNM